MRHVVAIATIGFARAARLNIHDELEFEASAETFVMAESVSMASGFFNLTLDADHEAAGKLCSNDFWPRDLNSKFTNHRYVGSGATACVFLATDKLGQTVAIKVGKVASAARKTAQLQEWTNECDDMKQLRVQACEGGKEVLKLHEHYMPSCFGVGSYSKGAYYAMHAAGPTPIRDAPNMGFTAEQSQKVFAQFVQAVYSLHVIGMSHNDLHGQNIVIKGDSLQLIDLGSLKTTVRSWKKGYKRDSNAIWRWGAVLAGCGSDAQWPDNKPGKAVVQVRADAFESCLKQKWSPDSNFMNALHILLGGDVEESKNHHILELYQTDWVQTRTPALKSKFVSDETKSSGCTGWSKPKWAQYWFKKDYPNHVKCETVPSYHWQTSKTKRGKTRTLDHHKCDLPGRTFDSACYKLGKNEIWGCGGCGNKNEPNSRACFFKTHPHYDKVDSFGR